MPEGPSIVIAKEQISQFIGRKVITAIGNAKIDIPRLEKKKLLDIKTWGKHLLLCFDGFTIRIHFLLFGTYRINETKEAQLRLSLLFSNGVLNIYTASVKVLEGNINDYYNWSEDVMNDNWNAQNAYDKLTDTPDKLICDVLLEQEIFSGVGNIIKNEILYRVQVHPESVIGKIPTDKKKEIIVQAKQYSFDFLQWKKANVLKQHWLAHTKKKCLRCDLQIHKKYTGTKNRRSFYCSNCQKLYE